MKDELPNKIIKEINRVFSKENLNKIFKRVSDEIKDKDRYNSYWNK